ncbi:MAG: hypothetical protein D6780_08280, partial [Candidatus Dadabacteria bacterium]
LMLKTLAYFLGFLLVLVLIVVYTFGYVVPPGYIGVRRIGFGPGQGYKKSVLKPGYHWGVPFFSYSTVHLVPTTVQVIHFHRNAPAKLGYFPPLEIQTTDGAKVIADLTLYAKFYKREGISENGIKHGGPVNLITEVGLTPKDWFNRIRRNAEGELRRALGELTTAQFYNPLLREEKINRAHKAMNEKLARFGIAVKDVLLRRYIYEAEQINEAIFRKNLQEQEVRLNSILREFEEVRAELRKTRAKYDAEIKTTIVSGQAKARVLRSEGDLFEKEAQAKGDLMVAEAKAKVTSLKAAVFNQGLGAKLYVARELLKLLSAIKGGVLSDFNPLDVSDVLNKFGVNENSLEKNDQQ